MTELVIELDRDGALELHDVTVRPDVTTGRLSFDVTGVVHLDRDDLAGVSGRDLEPTEVHFSVVEP